MQHGPPDSGFSRRSLLGATGATAIAVTAGCLDGVLSSNTSRQRIESTEPSEPREGTPGEFYYFLEENGIAVESLHREGDDLALVYDSSAETKTESDEEIGTIYQVYRRALIQRGSGVEQLIAEVADPFPDQAEAWGLDTEWVEQLENEEITALELWNRIIQTMSGVDRSVELEGGAETDSNETEANESVETDEGNESAETNESDGSARE